MRRGHQPPNKTDETAEFKELWEKVWSPVKNQFDGRALARDAYFRHVWFRGAEERDILDAARCYVRTAGSESRKLLFSNWLERGAYEDLAEQERAYQARIAEHKQRRSQDMTNVVPMSAAEQMSPEKKAEMAERLKGLAVSLRQA